MRINPYSIAIGASVLFPLLLFFNRPGKDAPRSTATNGVQGVPAPVPQQSSEASPLLSSSSRTGASEAAPARPTDDLLDVAGYRALIAESPLRAAATLENSKDTVLHDRWLSELLESWVERSPSAASRWVDNLSAGELKDAASEDLAYARALVEPEAAAADLARQIEAGESPKSLVPFVAAWGSRDPSAVAEWLSNIEGSVSPRAAGALAQVWGATDPRAAREWVAALEDPSALRSAAINLTSSWAETNAAAAIGWIKGMRGVPRSAKESAQLLALQAWAETNDASAAQWIGRLPRGAFREEATVLFAETVAEQDPAAALAWAQQVNDYDRQSETVVDIYGTWLEEDTGGAKVHLLESIGTLSQTDPLRQTLLDLLYQQDPEFRFETLKPFLQ